MTRRELVNGREYIVSSATILVEGVLDGSAGPLYYPKDEIAKDISQWNGRPLVNGHPIQRGKAISANDPTVIAEYEIGRMYNTEYQTNDGKPKLVSEVWFDVQMTKAIAPKILKKLERGEKIEVSTGLFTDNIAAPKGAKYEGKPYLFIARNFKPDHLAILLDEKGACSIKDGCGVNNQSSNNYPEECPHCNTKLEIDPDSGICNRCGKKVESLNNKGTNTNEPTDNTNNLNTATSSELSINHSPQELIEMFKDRNGVIDWFVTNCDTKISKSHLVQMKDECILDEIVKNAKDKAEGDDTATFMKWMTSAPSDIQNSMVQLMKNAMSGKTNQMPPAKEEEKKPTPPVPAATPPAATPNQPPAAKKPDMTDEEKAKMNLQQNQASKVKTLQEYLADPTMPAEIREAVTNSVNLTNKMKAQIIEQLVVNVSADKKQGAIEFYSSKPLSELEQLLQLMPQQQVNNSNNNILPITHFIGNAGGAVNNPQKKQYKPIPTQTINWREKDQAKQIN